MTTDITTTPTTDAPARTGIVARLTRRLGRSPMRTLTAAAVLAGGLAAPAVASAQPNYGSRGLVTAGFCWDRYTGYGTGFWIRTTLSNQDRVSHSAGWQVKRAGVVVASHNVVVGAGGGAALNTATVSVPLGDTFTFLIDGTTFTYGNIAATAVQHYMNNCDVQNTANPVINAALQYGVKQVGLHYVGGASPFRTGNAPGNGAKYQLAGQRAYLSPAGKYGFDCSGLVMRMWAVAGKPLSQGSSTGMLNAYTPIPGHKAYAQPGDLIVKSGHVAVYLGDGNGDGVASILEASPTAYNTATAESPNGVNIVPQSDYFNADGSIKAGWYLRRIP